MDFTFSAFQAKSGFEDKKRFASVSRDPSQLEKVEGEWIEGGGDQLYRRRRRMDRRRRKVT